MKKTVIGLLLALGIVAALGQAGGRFIAQWQNAGTAIGTFTSYMRMNCSTGLTCTYSGGTVTLTSSGGSPASCSTVSFSATPTFSGASSTTCFKITLTGDVTSSTFSNGASGANYNFIVCQDSTGARAFVPPTSMHEYGTWMATASNCVTQQFSYDGTNLNAIASWNADTRPFTPNAMDDEFDSNTFNTSTLWTWVNQGTAAVTETSGYAKMTGQASTTAFRFLEQTLPSAPWEFTLKVSAWAVGDFSHCGMGIRESSTAKGVYFGTLANAASANSFGGFRYTNDTTQSGTAFSSNGAVQPSTPYLRINRTSTTLTYSHSTDGISFITDGTEAITASFTTAPNQVGLENDAEGSSAPTCSYDWFRRTQ